MEFIRSNILKDHTSATEVIEKDLPTGAISHLIFTVEGEQTTDEATLAELIAFINSIEVTKKGKSIISVQSEDLYGLNAYLFRKLPVLTNSITTDDAVRHLGLIVPFGRNIFDPEECYPATQKGDLTVRADMTVLGTSIDSGLVNIEAVELVGAQPTHYLKSTLKIVAAPGATGDNEVELPIGNKLVAIQIRMTTFPTTATDLYGVQDVSLMVNNKQYGYAMAKAPCMVSDRMFRIGGLGSTMLLQQLVLPPNIIWMDFDPNGDGKWLIDTADKSSVKLRLNMGVNEATYITIIELVEV
jgi:hypothetical protein